MTNSVFCLTSSGMEFIRKRPLHETRSPEEAAKAVVEAAGKATKADNAAVIVLALNAPEPVPKRDAAQSRFRRSPKTGASPRLGAPPEVACACCRCLAGFFLLFQEAKRHRHNRI